MCEIVKFRDYLKNQGFTNDEIQMAIDIKTNGITMVKAMYLFNELYDGGKIDGFPDSSIEVLEKFYGRRLKKMKFNTIYDKVYTLQRTIIDKPDEYYIRESVKYYLNI